MNIPVWKQQFEKQAAVNSLPKVAIEKQAYNKYNPIDTFSLFINALRNEKMGFPPEAKDLADELSKKYGRQIMQIWTTREK